MHELRKCILRGPSIGSSVIWVGVQRLSYNKVSNYISNKKEVVYFVFAINKNAKQTFWLPRKIIFLSLRDIIYTEYISRYVYSAIF